MTSLIHQRYANTGRWIQYQGGMHTSLVLGVYCIDTLYFMEICILPAGGPKPVVYSFTLVVCILLVR